MNRLSKVFRPFNRPQRTILKKFTSEPETQSKAYKLLLNYGIINRTATGFYHLLPMGQRIIDKLTRLIDREMKSIGAEKMTIPFLTKQILWEKTDTYSKSKDELYHVTDRSGIPFLLSPTHEQSFTDMLSKHVLSYKDYPRLLYQVTPKFRDEHRPKLGMLRSKEFIMKDLYSFDVNEKAADTTYSIVTTAYEKIFKTLEIPFQKISNGADGLISKSQEYFYFSEVGDDHLYNCPECDETVSASSMKDKDSCPLCFYPQKVENFVRGIEVAHTFSFGTSYSSRLGSYYVDNNCKKQALHMCSYGIGVSRLLSATAELLSVDDNLRWPLAMAPYLVCIIPPKAGSREEIAVELLIPEIYDNLESVATLKDEIIIDDRTDLTIGKRLLEAKLFGFPFIIVAGKDSTRTVPVFEIFDVIANKLYIMPKSSLIQLLIDKTETLGEIRSKKHYIAGDQMTA